ncbi:hypothetical protein TNCT_403221 [Trichonephila clavata]|uniref:Uncharacterized protein n=1 Tax=Trichonephila clavata TaxID=2740835 RepID=A0A8X6HB20_TRICU|nr:hypothetical protein TNCT_403221 [Trichonephila clavata]
MELVSNSAVSTKNTMLSTCPWTAGYLPEQKCIHHTTNSGLKLSMNILRTLTSNTGFHTTRRSLRPLVGHPYSFRNDTEKRLFYSPRHRGFRFPAVQHTCLFRLQSNANLSMDLLRHSRRNGSLRNRNCPRTLIRKVLIQQDSLG